MPKIAKELTPLAISKIKNQGWHAVGHVAGLGLKVSSTGARSWVLRVMVAGKRREFGLGGFPTTQLASAKERARAFRDQIFAGNDPTVSKQEAKSALIAAKAKSVTFNKLAEQYIEQHESGWKNSKHSAQCVDSPKSETV